MRSIVGRLRRRPKLALLLAVAGVLAGAGAFYLYALRQWDAARFAAADGRVPEARSRLAFCQTVWPGSPDVWLLAARVARMGGEYDAAEDHLRRCTRLQGGASRETQIEHLLIRVQTGEVDEVADPLFEAVEAGHPEREMILSVVAQAYMHQLRYGPAFACLSKWVEVAPDAAKPRHWRGWVLERLNNNAGAMQEYLATLDRDPAHVQARLRVAEMLLEDHKPEEARPHLEQLRARLPDKPEVAGRLGQCRFLEGKTDEARSLLTEAVAKIPNDPPVLLYLAKLDLQEGKPAEAEVRLRHALTVDPADTEARYNLSNALSFQGRTAEAAAEMARYEEQKTILERANKLLQAVADKPATDPKEAAEIGGLLMKVGQERLAVYWLERALERDPRNVAANTTLAELYEKKGEPAKAAPYRRRLAPSPGQAGR